MNFVNGEDEKLLIFGIRNYIPTYIVISIHIWLLRYFRHIFCSFYRRNYGELYKVLNKSKKNKEAIAAIALSVVV